MRIGLIRMRYSPYGGAEVFLKRFVSELVKRRHGVEVFSSSWEASEGVTVHKVKAQGPSFLRPLSFARNVAKEVERVKPDVVLSLERTYCQDIYRAGDGCHREWLLRRAGAVSSAKRLAISLNPLHKVMLDLEKRLFTSPRLKKVVANSMRVKDDILRHYGLPEEKICVIYNGIELGAFKDIRAERARLRADAGASDDTVVLLYVGSGFERKGLLYAVRALGLLKGRADVRLLVIGKGNPAPYQEEARMLGVKDRVVFKGPVEGALRYYGAGDIFVLPSIYEPFSNACLEAMAAGLPVVTTRVNGASEIITDGVNGAIAEDATDAVELAHKIEALLDEKKRLKAGELARIEALKYPIEKNVSEFLKVIEEVRR